MRKALLATASSAALLAAGPALAADMINVGVGGFMHQWVGGTNVETETNGRSVNTNEGVSQATNSEVHIKANIEADNGLTFGVKVEIEAQGDGNSDEAAMTVGGEFGQIVLGTEDHAAGLMHHSVGTAGAIGISGGIVGWFVPNMGGLDTAFDGDANNISYYTPRMNGVQIGASFIPDSTQEGSNLGGAADNDRSAWSVGANYVGEFGGTNLALSLGHKQTSQVLAAKIEDDLEGHEHPVKVMVDNPVKKIDDATTTNVGISVGIGAFTAAVAYAALDDGEYAIVDNEERDVTAGDYDVASVGGMYVQGPLSFSLGHIMADYENGDDKSLTELGVGYVLAPGVGWHSSLFLGEYDVAARRPKPMQWAL